jgi:hypothetical protein
MRISALSAAIAAVTPAAVLTPVIVFAQASGAPGDAATGAPSAEIALPTVNIVGSSPLLGSGIDRNKLPAQTSVLNSGDIARDGTPNALRALNEQVGGVNLDSASGNPDQPTLLYHGFEASPLLGVPQGLAVYVNGARFNDAFGDTVNWDLIPSLAIGQLNLEGPNPVFGLNALGGSIRCYVASATMPISRVTLGLIEPWVISTTYRLMHRRTGGGCEQVWWRWPSSFQMPRKARCNRGCQFAKVLWRGFSSLI